jgi:hypothetical protein
MENKENKVKGESKAKTNAEKIWEEIKDKQINMFTLPNQLVNQYCVPTSIEPSKLYVTYTVSSILPALENALGSSYKVENAGRFLAISYTEQPIG